MSQRTFSYPDGYQDPEYDGTMAGFRDVVIPARAEALKQSLNETFADVLPDGVRFEWGAARARALT